MDSSSIVYTPNTKLRIDTAILGPYAQKLTFIQGKPVKPATFNGSVQQQGTVNIERKEKDFSAFHRKQSVALTQDSKGRRETRLSIAQSRQKDRRFETLMEKRVQAAGSSTPSSMAELLALKNKESTLKNSKSTFGTNVNQNNPSTSRREQLLRWKDQKTIASTINQKKGPKPAATVIQARGQALPNNSNKNVTSKPSSNPQVLKQPLVNGTQSTGTVPNHVNNNMNKVGNPRERRVTRAMSKAQTTAPVPYTNIRLPITKLKNLNLFTDTIPASFNVNVKKSGPSSSKSSIPSKPENGIATRQLKKDAVSSSSTAPAVGNVPLDVIMEPVPPPQNNVARSPPPPPVTSVTVGIQAPTPGRLNIQTPPPPPPPAPKARAKPKGMQFDQIYVEYNNFFLEAGTALMHETDYLKKIVEVAVNLPEDVLSDIESTLGQAKLLMDSKLPQFGQLLYFYLSKENNPGPVLPCDLQGWWDVASIQVEKVKARFNELRIREKNAWKKPEPDFPVVSQKVKAPPKSMKKSTSSNSSDNPSVSDCNALANKKTKPTQASSGLRQFLASRRKNVNSVSEEAPAPETQTRKVSTRRSEALCHTPKSNSDSSNPRTPVVPTSASLRKFEGGFFQIASPVRPNSAIKPNVFTPLNKNTATLRTNAASSPASRQVTGPRRSSLVTLAVRKSMGSMFKTPGTGGQLTDPAGEETMLIDPTDFPNLADYCDPHHYPPPVTHHHQHQHPGSSGSYSACSSESKDYLRSKSCQGRLDRQNRVNKMSLDSSLSHHRHRHHPHTTSLSHHYENSTTHPEVIGTTTTGTTTNTAVSPDFPSWSPFSYDQISLFNNNLLGSELQLLYPDWPKEIVEKEEEESQHHQHYHEKRKEIVVVGGDRVEKKKESSSSSSSVRTPSSAYVSFLARPLHSDLGSSKSYYCEIFGSQNVMDLHPEYSPFDSTIDIEQSLVDQHLWRDRGDVEDSTTTTTIFPNILEQDVNNNDIFFRTNPTATCHDNPLPLPPVSAVQLDGHENLSLSEDEERNTPDIFEQPEFSLVHSIQCKVCDIYQSMKSRRKLSKYTGINISVECTNCGRFTDITQHRDTRQHSSSQPSSDEIFETNENGND